MVNDIRLDIRGLSKDTAQVIEEYASHIGLSRSKTVNLILDDYAEAFRQKRASALLRNNFEEVINAVNILTKTQNEIVQQVISGLNSYSEKTDDTLSRLENITLRLEAIEQEQKKNLRS